MHTLKPPRITAASNANGTPDGRSGSDPGARVTRITATIAATMPTTAAGCGTPSSMNPTVTGTTAESTPVVGATTPIRPTARPRYRQVIPTTPKIAARNARPTSGGAGNGSPRATASTRAATAPTPWVTATTASTGARRVTRPPPKSPDPQHSAEARPRTTTATSGARSASGRLLERGVAVDGGRTVQDDDL